MKHLASLGVTAVSISSQSVFDVSKVENGDYSLVFGSPEAWIKNDCWTMSYIHRSCVPWQSMNLMSYDSGKLE